MVHHDYDYEHRIRKGANLESEDQIAVGNMSYLHAILLVYGLLWCFLYGPLP